VIRLRGVVTDVAWPEVPDPEGDALIGRVREERLTYLPPVALLDLRRRMQEIEAQSVPGRVIEAGCALGGSAIVIAASKIPSRPMDVHDVFGLIPPPSERDGEDVHGRYEKIVGGEARGLGGDVYYGYREDLAQTVADSFTRLGVDLATNHVRLVKGLFQDTLHPDGPVSFAHIDGDWYESVAVCLERIWPRLSVGGVIVVDDYHFWSGCRTAVDEFLAVTPDVRVEKAFRIHLVKTA
jgi:asparagine synthase (glutamine-hydrolysing)